MESINTNNTFYLDSHCHLQLLNNTYNLSKLLDVCIENKINYYLLNSTSDKDFNKVISISKEYSINNKIKILPNLGYHPWYLKDMYDNIDIKNKKLEDFTTLIDNMYKQYVDNKQQSEHKFNKFGIGEIGIDNFFSIKDIDMEFQLEVLEYQLNLAEKYSLFVSIHCVRAMEDLIKFFKKYFKKNKKYNLIEKRLILLHSYPGNKQQTKLILKLINPWFSLSSASYCDRMYSTIQNIIPIENIVLESDTPSLFNINIFESNEDKAFLDSNFKFENEKYINNPLSIKILSKKIAKLKGIDEEEFAKKIMLNNDLILKSFE